MENDKVFELKKYLENLETLKAEFAKKKYEFEHENQDLIDSISKESVEIDLIKDDLKIQAIKEFKESGVKKLLGGIGIRILTKLKYVEMDAINWSECNMPVALKTVLDKKQFETYAKSNELDFVKKEESISVTFPKDIKL